MGTSAKDQCTVYRVPCQRRRKNVLRAGWELVPVVHGRDPRAGRRALRAAGVGPRGNARVIRALRYLRDKAGRNRAAIERELAFFRKNRKRMRYRDLSDRGVAIGSGPALAKAGVEAANKILVTQRMKRSGMRWRIHGGQAVLTVRALIKSGRFDRAWAGLMGDADTPANDNNCTGNATKLAA